MKNVLTTVNKNIILMMSLFLSLIVVTSCNKDDEAPDNPTPDPSTVVASFTSQVDADNSLTYDFTNSSVVNGITDKTFTSAWAFGTDGTSTDENPSHTFSGEGSYEVTLTVTATDGVEASTTETIEVTAPKNRYAAITDADSEDNGELRLQMMDSIRNGRVTYMFRLVEGATATEIKDGFINVAGNSTTSDFSIVEVRLKDEGSHGFREGASDATIAEADALWPDGQVNVWESVEVSWSANGTDYPTYTVKIGDVTIITDATSTTNGGVDDEAPHLEATKEGMKNLQWKYSDKSSVNDAVYHVDDIVVYSSDSGTETVVFEDNFQGRTAGDLLNPVDNLDSPYHSNTYDCLVGEDQ